MNAPADNAAHHASDTCGKSPGQLAYERDLAKQPNYHDGTRRLPWALLDDWRRETWERYSTDWPTLAGESNEG